MNVSQKVKQLLKAAERATGFRREATPGAMARTEAMPGEGMVKAEIGGMRAEAPPLAPAAEQRLAALGPEAAYLLPNEAEKAAKLTASVQSMQRMLDFVPKAKELAAVMKAGGAKRGWYRASAQAIIDTFGEQDAPRFAALLAATSPQTSVESNLTNALNVWKNWTAAGRPTDERAIKSIMGRSVQGNKGEQSVLDAWVNNSLRALQAEDPSKIVLSGPKVDSFMGNLADDVFRVTQDAWQAKLMGVSQEMFSGSKAGEFDPGLTPGYLAGNARMRHAADLAGMTPAEGQETAWSFAMQLYEAARKSGRSVVDLINSPDATDALIRGAPDFSTLFGQPQYRSILEEAGYGSQLAALQPHVWPEMGGHIRERVSPEEWKLIQNVGRGLDQVAEQAKRESFASNFWKNEGGDRLPVWGTYETTPYGASGHLTGFQDLSEKSQAANAAALAGAFQNPAGRDILHEALGLPGIETRTARGFWKPEEGAVEVNPAYAAGIELPLTKAGELRKTDREALAGAEAVRGYMTAQGGSAATGMVPEAGGGGFFIPGEGRLSKEAMQALGDVASQQGFGVADVGGGTALFPFSDGGQLGPEAIVGARRALSTPATMKDTGAEYTALPQMVEARRQGVYIPYEDAWKAPQGSGAVARAMFEQLDALPKSKQSALSEALMQPAGDLYEKYRTMGKSKDLPVREDLMNALQILRTQGLDGLRKALERGDFIAGLGAGAALLPWGGEEQMV